MSFFYVAVGWAQQVILWIFQCGYCEEIFICKTNEDNVIQQSDMLFDVFNDCNWS